MKEGSKNSTAFPQRLPEICPCCRQVIPPQLVVSGPLRTRVLDLVARRPDGISLPEIAAIVYSDCREPKWSHGCIKSTVFAANKELRPQGWMIRARHGPGARYRLLPVEA